MRKIGLVECWIDLVMRCISPISFEVLVNGYLGKSFSPQRGLRQGDPLSPYLFVLCTESLSIMINQAKEQNQFSGAKVSSVTPKMSNLFFIDDSIIFSKAKAEDYGKILDLLDLYGRASRQRVNYDKSSIFFIPNTSRSIKQSICQLCRVTNVAYSERYLGLPSMVGRSKNNAF